MNMLNDIKKELSMEIDDISMDESIQNNIEIAEAILKAELNNENISTEDDKIIYLAVKYFALALTNDETRLGVSAGKTSENMGITIAFMDALPKYILTPLKLKYYKVRLAR